MNENAFELNLQPFTTYTQFLMSELLQPYFLPLLDTLEVTQHLAPTNINPNYMDELDAMGNFSSQE
jgi:hypothetical protein